MPSETPAKQRLRIGSVVRGLREQRSFTQAELANRLGMSQARLSLIERGKASLSAEQFLEILRIFRVSVTAFVEPADHAAEIQATLARLGAFHLQEDAAVLPSERLERVSDAIRETLVDADSPRLITALAPVIVRNIEKINWPKLSFEMTSLGLARRFRWLIDNVRAAVTAAADDAGVPTVERRQYRRAEAILAGVSELAEEPNTGPKLPPDVLDRGIRTRKSRVDAEASGSPMSRRWQVVTAIQPSDFAEALRGARGGR